MRSWFHVRPEGGFINHGVNVWPKNDPASVGFIFRGSMFECDWKVIVRWSKIRHRLFIDFGGISQEGFNPSNTCLR